MNSIVVPIYKNWKLCHDLLNSLRKHEKDNIGEVVVVNDCSQDPEVEGGLEFWRDVKLFPVKIITNEVNVGFTVSSNRGLREAKHESVFLISSDVRIGGKFLEHANSLITPNSFVGHKLLSGSTGWNNFDGKIFPYLEGYFLAAKNFVWEDLGYLDEAYAPWDFEDVDISTTAVSKGYSLVPTNNPAVSHLGGMSIGYSPKREEITVRNKEYFRRKWLG